MTGFDDCITGLLDAGRLTREQAEEIRAVMAKHRDRYARTLPLDAAEAAAAERAARDLAEAKALQKRQRALHVQKAREIGGNMLLHADGVGEGGLSHLTKSTTSAPWSNVEYRMDSWKGILRGSFIGGIAAFRTKSFGLRQDRAGLHDFIHESYRRIDPEAGRDTGNKMARGAAEAWEATTETGRRAANAAGAAIRRRWNWVVPNVHNAARIHRAGFDTWMRDVLALDIEVRDELTGLALDGEELERALGEIYRTLASGGLNKLEDQVFTGRPRKLANRLGDPRTLQFRTADSWLKYNRTYGAADVFGLLMGHIDHMARDIAMMEVLGPNPDAMVRHMRKLIEESGDPSGLMRSRSERLQTVYDVLTGRLNSPVRELWYRAFGAARNVLSTAILGRAPLSALSDIRFIAQTAGFNGIPAVKVMGRYLKNLNPADEKDRIRAARSGLVAEAWTARGVAAARYQDELLGDGFSARMADTFHRVTGLTKMTEAGRLAFQQEFYGFLADHADSALASLPEALRNAFERYGIDEALWDAARRHGVTLVHHEGIDVPFLDIVALAKSADPEGRAGPLTDDVPERFRAAQRLHEMVLAETDYAVPTPDARTRSFLAFGRRGTFWGEVVRSLTMYKSFSVAVMHTHLMRGIAEARKGRYGYLPSLLIGLTAFGALSLQAKDLSKGKDPRDMWGENWPDWRFWGAAFAQGGGLGIFGDFFYAWMSRADGSALETSAGPLAQLVLTDIPRLGFSNARQFYAGEDTGFGAEMVRLVKRYMPGTSIWYAGLALEREVWDRLQVMADPHWARNFARMERRARRTTGQEYWWPPGEELPDRFPDPAAAIGGP